MAGLCEGGNEPPGSLKASKFCYPLENFNMTYSKSFANTSYNGWGNHCANHTIPPFWLDDRPPLRRHVGVRPAAGWSVQALHGL
ncbi:hypothetical protein ANN_23491 [Periplaneta americana]|uniref:Uncharacterized protein n=1 Tax=Periplaneta americana TaxID=6978 RepID=A0ABQ8SL83_PERAM|nr:hypothetical protein ANN_23491 [Periplaneta americana]